MISAQEENATMDFKPVEMEVTKFIASEFLTVRLEAYDSNRGRFTYTLFPCYRLLALKPFWQIKAP